MKIAYGVRAIFPQHGFGGLERASFALVRHLLAQSVDVALFTQPIPPGQPISISPTPPGHLTVHPIRYGRLPLRSTGIPARLTNYRAFVDEMGKRIRSMSYSGRLDGIYTQGLCAYGVRQATLWGVPTLANPQGLEEFKTTDPLKRLAYAPFRAWVRAGCQAADRVIATDAAMRNEVATHLKIHPSKVAVIPNGVDVEEISSLLDAYVQAELAQRWPLLAGRPDALKGISVGRMEANKGFERLLQALSQAQPSLGADWLWILVGDGSLRNRLQALSLQLGMEDHVIFSGSLSDAELHNLYEMCNLFAHPTLYEGSSLVTLEAMSHSLPVVASAVGGIPDKVVEGETGFLVRPSDEAQLADRILWLAAHPEERRQFGRRASQFVAAKFDWQTIADQTIALFDQVRDEKAACRPFERAQPPC